MIVPHYNIVTEGNSQQLIACACKQVRSHSLLDSECDKFAEVYVTAVETTTRSKVATVKWIIGKFVKRNQSHPT